MDHCISEHVCVHVYRCNVLRVYGTCDPVLSLIAKLNNPSDSSIPKLKEVFVALVPNLQPRWYEIFLNLGIQRRVLEEYLQNHQFDDQSALIHVIALWLQKSDPPPSWRNLVNVVQNILLEGKVAIEIKRKFCRDLLLESEGTYYTMPA